MSQPRQVPALSGTPITAQKTNTAFTANVATATGGTATTPGGYTARINWGDHL